MSPRTRSLFGRIGSSRPGRRAGAALALVAACAFALTLGAAGCDYEPEVGKTALPPAATPAPPTPPDPNIDPNDPDPIDPTPSPVVVDPVAVDLGDDRPATLTPPTPAPELPTRPRRRMDIDQLDRAITQVTGGFAWTERVGSRDVNQFEALAETLGRPDFIETTQEDLDPSALFSKFLGEAARTVCDRLATAEAEGTAPEAVLLRHVTPTDTHESAPEAVDANLAALLLRFHGARVAPTDPAFEPWRWLFASAVHVSDDPLVAWRTVCVGLIVHPDFTTY